MTKPHTQIKAILFDFGGVLAEEGFRNGLLALATEQGLDIATMPTAAMNAVYDSGFVLGTGRAEDFWARLRERTGLQGEDEALSQRILSGFILRPWMMAVVKHCREKGLLTGILSDQTHWLDTLDERDHFYHAFDVVFNSYTRGKGKQDPSVFTDVASELQLPTDEILFVDDDAGNIERAKSAGMLGLQYIDKERFIQQLRQLTGIQLK